MSEYSCKILSASKELNSYERIKLKDVSNAVKLDEVLNDGSITIQPVLYAVLDIHNEKAKDNKDYRKMVIVDKSGTKFVTGSASFARSFEEIVDELADDGIDFESAGIEVEVYKKDSKNYSGKSFITCSLA